jgi:hypothetical protein
MLTRRKKIQKNQTMRIDDQSHCMDKICSQKKYEKEYNNIVKLIIKYSVIGKIRPV